MVIAANRPGSDLVNSLWFWTWEHCATIQRLEIDDSYLVLKSPPQRHTVCELKQDKNFAIFLKSSQIWLILLDQDNSEADDSSVMRTVPPNIWFLFYTSTCSYRNNHLPIVELTLFNWRKLPGRSQTPPLPQIRNWNVSLIEFAEDINLNLINTFFIFFHCIPVSKIKLCICLSPT